MKFDLPKVSCCLCIQLGDYATRAETVVKGYAVCGRHSMVMDEAASLKDAVGAVRREVRR